MLDTLLKIGEWQSQGKSEWDRFLDYPKANREENAAILLKTTHFQLFLIWMQWK